jgi:hypothetical protein
MPESEERTSPRMIAEMMGHYARIAEERPEFVRLIHDKVVYHLREGQPLGGGPMWDHLAEHFKAIAPLVMSDPEVVEKFPAIVDTYRELQTSDATRLREGPGDHSVGPWAGIASGVGIILVGIAIYCTSDVDTPPGTSAEVPHVPGFC